MGTSIDKTFTDDESLVNFFHKRALPRGAKPMLALLAGNNNLNIERKVKIFLPTGGIFFRFELLLVATNG